MTWIYFWRAHFHCTSNLQRGAHCGRCVTPARGARRPLCHSSTRRSMCRYHSPWLQRDPRDISNARFQRCHSAGVQVFGPRHVVAACGPEEDAAAFAFCISSAHSLANVRALAFDSVRRLQTQRQRFISPPNPPRKNARKKTSHCPQYYFASCDLDGLLEVVALALIVASEAAAFACAAPARRACLRRSFCRGDTCLHARTRGPCRDRQAR